MSTVEMSKKLETWGEELERLVAKKMTDNNPTEVLMMVRRLFGGELTHDEWEEWGLRLKIREFRFLTQEEKQQAAIRQINADRKRRGELVAEIGSPHIEGEEHA